MVVKVKESFEKTRQVMNTYNCKYTLVFSLIYLCINWFSLSYKYSYNCKYVPSIITNIIVSIYILKIMTNLKNIFYEEKEM